MAISVSYIGILLGGRQSTVRDGTMSTKHGLSGSTNQTPATKQTCLKWNGEHNTNRTDKGHTKK